MLLPTVARPVVCLLSAAIMSLFPIAASADGQIVVFPHYHIPIGANLQSGNVPKGIVPALGDSRVMLVRPQFDGSVTLQSNAETSIVPVNVHALLTANVASAIRFDDDLVIPVPTLDSVKRSFIGSTGQPLDFVDMLTARSKSLPGLSPEENEEFLELSRRLQTLDKNEFARLQELFDKGISVPTNTRPIRPFQFGYRIVDLKNADCSDGKDLPDYCELFIAWKPPNCVCD